MSANTFNLLVLSLYTTTPPLPKFTVGEHVNTKPVGVPTTVVIAGPPNVADS